MREATAQLPGFIFYLGVGAVLLVIAAALEVFGEHFSEKRRKDARREALRARAWAEIELLEETA